MATTQSLNIFISGGARGIGRGLSRLLLQRGHRVFVVDNDRKELDHCLHTYGKQFAHDQWRCMYTDLRDPGDVKSAAQEASTHFNGHLDLLVNNAAYTGGVMGTALEHLTLEEWNASIETNLTAPMLLSQACLPMLKRNPVRPQGGAIVHMSSTRAHQSEPNSEGYASTKAGLIGLTHSMAVSLKPMGITVNAILPGWIHVANECEEADHKGTPWEEGLGQEDHDFHPSGRVGRVEDVLAAVEYLVGARFVTGTEVVVAGGVDRVMYYPE